MTEITKLDDKYLVLKWDDSSITWMEDYSDEMIKWSDRKKLIEILA